MRFRNRIALGGANGPALQGPGNFVDVYGAEQAAIGDFDGDGNQDLGLPQFSDQGIEIALGDGAGSFVLDPAGPFAFEPVQPWDFWPQETATLDLNGDGRLDVAAVSGNSGILDQGRGVQILLGQPAPGISVSPTSVSFGSVPGNANPPAPAVVTVSSNGEVPLTLDGTRLGGSDPNRFQITGGTCQPGSVGSSCTIEVGLRPAGGQGPLTADLEIPSDATGEPVKVPLSATVTAPVDPPPTGRARLSLKVKSAGKVKVGKKLLVVATVRNSGNAASGAVVLRASAPKKATRRVKAQRIRSVESGKRVIRKLRIPVKKGAQGRFKVKLSLISEGRTMSAKVVKVKVLKR